MNVEMSKFVLKEKSWCSQYKIEDKMEHKTECKIE